ncbi:hypothetical protein F2Q69_00025020 [Brassica cretica]|uniref:Uncharacterized protein n=1 Tax=Brassica cretica TaxID=69181 RepID=A0A8S9QGQ8_BRACR|nr:hypothetical protein F2Q69_00025020 [Brassica cretica]
MDAVEITEVVDTGVIAEDVKQNEGSVTHDVSQTEDSELQGEGSVTQPETCVTPTEEEPEIKGEELRQRVAVADGPTVTRKKFWVEE